MESDADDDDVPSRELKDRKTSFKRKKRKHDSLKSCSDDDGELNRYNTHNPRLKRYNIAEDIYHRARCRGLYNINDGWILSFGPPEDYRAWCRGLYNMNDGWVYSFGRPKEPMTKEDDDGNEELFERKREQLDENVSPMSDCVSSRQRGTICDQGYNVKQSFAPILEVIFKKHGDIAAECQFKTASVRSKFLEVVCEVVTQIETDDVIEKMEEIECQVSDAEAANINVSWLRAHLEAVHKRKEAMKRSDLLMETKIKTSLVKRAAQMDLRERCEELVAAQERFEKAERCARVLNLVEKNLKNAIVASKAEDALLLKQRVLYG